jgi:type IV secretion system protein TrbC
MFVRLLSSARSCVPRIDEPQFLQFGTAIACVLVSTSAAHAAGSGMPWEAPLQRVLDSVQGPVAKIVAVIIITVTGISLAFGDTSGGFRRMVQVVFGLSIAFAASSFFLSFFSFGGGALI